MKKIIAVAAIIELLISATGIAATRSESPFPDLQSAPLGHFADLEEAFRLMTLLPQIQKHESAGLQALEAGDYQEALEEWRKGLQLAREAEFSIGIGEFLANMAGAYFYLGEYRKARDHYLEALPLLQEFDRKLGERRMEGLILTNVASTYLRLGEYAKALDYFQQALRTYRAGGIRQEAPEESISGNLLSGQLPRALLEQFEASGVIQGLSSERGEARALSNIGVVYSELGQHDKALEYYQQALATHRRLADPHGEATNLVNMGSAYQHLDRHQEALVHYQKALTIFQKTGRRGDEGSVLNNLGIVHGKLGEYPQALDYYEKALTIHRETGNRSGEGSVLGNIGHAYQHLGIPEEALARFREAKDIFQKIGAPQGLFLARRGVAAAEAQLTRYKSAIEHYEQALAILEGLRAGLVERGQQASFLSENLFAYDEFIQLLLRLQAEEPGQGYDRKAFEVFERKQGRVFLEEVGASGARRFAGLPPSVIQRETDLGDQLAAIRSHLLEERSKPADRLSQERVHALEQRLQTLERDRRALETEIKANYPDYYALKYPTPVALNELQTQILQPGEMMLIYGVMEDSTALWIVGRDEFQIFTLPVDERNLQEQVNAIRHLLGARLEEGSGEQAIILRGVTLRWSETKLNSLTEQTHDLYTQLLPESVRGLLKENRLVYIVPTGPLYALPFETLVTQPGEQPHYLIEDYPIAYLSSASLLRTLREAETRKQSTARYPFLAFADPVYEKASEKKAKGDSIWGGVFPKLPETAEEAREIAMLFESPTESDPLQLREQAARSRVLELNDQQRLDDYRYLLFATHGILPGEIDRITQPALVLTHPEKDGGDGFLTMADVFGLDLNAELVSLSACNTGMGERVRGEGVLGLSRAFMYAGTPAVAMTLWSVESLSAKELSVGLFRHLKETSQPAEALRQIKLEMLRGEMGEAYRHPRYWAPLVVFGDAGATAAEGIVSNISLQHP